MVRALFVCAAALPPAHEHKHRWQHANSPLIIHPFPPAGRRNCGPHLLGLLEQLALPGTHDLARSFRGF